MKVINFLECGCAIYENGRRALCPTCLNPAAPDTELEGILRDAFSKYRRGEEKHGVIDIDKDQRDFLKEAEDELLDAIVYCAFEIGRLRRLREKLGGQGHVTVNIINPMGNEDWDRLAEEPTL